MWRDTACPNGCVGIGHHLLKSRISLDFFQVCFPIGKMEQSLADDLAAVAAAVLRQLIEDFLAPFVQNELVSHRFPQTGSVT